MKLTTQKLKQIIKEELKGLLKERMPGYYIELVDGYWNEKPYSTEEEAEAELEDLPEDLQDEYPAPRIIKIG